MRNETNDQGGSSMPNMTVLVLHPHPTNRCTGIPASSRLFLSQKSRQSSAAGERRRWADNRMCRSIRNSLLAVLLGTISVVGHTEELRADDAIVLIKFKNSDRSIDSSLAKLTFASLDSNKSIRVRLKDNLQKLVVSAGSYYLRSVETGFTNMVVIDRPKPTDTSSVIEVPAGSVVYLGDHGFDKKFEFHIEFLQESLLEAVEMKLPDNLPIYVSSAGLPPRRLKLK